MRMNVGTSSINKNGKAKTGRAIPALRRAQHCWHAHSQLYAMMSKKFHVTYGTYIQDVAII